MPLLHCAGLAWEYSGSLSVYPPVRLQLRQFIERAGMLREAFHQTLHCAIHQCPRRVHCLCNMSSDVHQRYCSKRSRRKYLPDISRALFSSNDSHARALRGTAEEEDK